MSTEAITPPEKTAEEIEAEKEAEQKKKEEAAMSKEMQDRLNSIIARINGTITYTQGDKTFEIPPLSKRKACSLKNRAEAEGITVDEMMELLTRNE